MKIQTIDVDVAMLEPPTRVGVTRSSDKESPTAYFRHYELPWKDEPNDIVILKIEGEDTRAFKRISAAELRNHIDKPPKAHRR